MRNIKYGYGIKKEDGTIKLESVDGLHKIVCVFESPLNAVKHGKDVLRNPEGEIVAVDITDLMKYIPEEYLYWPERGLERGMQ